MLCTTELPLSDKMEERNMATINVYKVASGKGDLPFTPYVHIYLSDFTNDSVGYPLMSPQLMTDVEIDETIDYLVSQLEKVRKTAKLKLKKIKERGK
jgi:hypothetical protein